MDQHRASAMEQNIQAAEKQIKRVSQSLSELTMLCQLNKREISGHIALRCVEYTERLALIVRSLPFCTRVSSTPQLINKAILAEIPVKMGYTEENWFCLRIPMLLPRKEHGGSEYIRGWLYPAMQDFFRDTEPVRYNNCVLIFRHVYDRNRPERQYRDHDNIELNMVVDSVAMFLLYDDAPMRCRHYYTSVAGTEERTEVYVVPFENFLEWLEKEPSFSDEGVKLFEKRHSATK